MGTRRRTRPTEGRPRLGPGRGSSAAPEAGTIARGAGRGGGGALSRAPPPARPPRSQTRSHTDSHPPPAQALPAGAAAAAAPAMDVRLYPSAPAVGARPGAEPAGLAHLDYYHCGKVGGGRVGARAGGAGPRLRTPRGGQSVPGCSPRRSHLAARDAGALGDTWGELPEVSTRRDTHSSAPPTGTCHSRSRPELFGSQAEAPDSHSHGDTDAHTHPPPPDSFTSIRKLTHRDPCPTQTAL